jgi:adenylate cyclase
MVRLAASNAPDKLLAEEELALFRLVNDIAENEHVVYALITDQDDMIKADSRVDEVDKVYLPPSGLVSSGTVNDVHISSFDQGPEELLLFEKEVTYQDLKVGVVRLVISQKGILQSVRDAKINILFLTIIILLLGALLSLGLSMYFSRPILTLRESAEILGTGDFRHRVRITRNDELGDLGVAFNRMSEGLEEREVIRDTFGKYVSPEIRDEILSGRIPLDGEKRVGSLLFSDLRDFTPYVEKNAPEEVIRGMRAYFTAMQEAISLHGGLVLQYVGDEIEAVFGLPLLDEDHAEKAVKAALEMKKSLAALNRERSEQGLGTFRHGIGIHTGEVLAGNSGSNDRPTYTLIGDTVNLASRIQGLTKEVKCDILASEETVKRLSGPFELKEESPMQVKGYSRPVVVYQVLG